MESSPRAAFEVIESELLFELLMDLFAGPTRFDHSGEIAELRFCGVIRDVIPTLVGSLLADEPVLWARKAFARCRFLAIRETHATGSEAGAEGTLGSVAPGHTTKRRLPQRLDNILCLSNHVGCHGMFARLPTAKAWARHPHGSVSGVRALIG